MSQQEKLSSDLSIDDQIKQLYLNSFPIVFIDPSGRYNLAGRMDTNNFDDFVSECSIAMELLSNRSGNDVFQKIFIFPINDKLKVIYLLLKY